MYSLTWSRKKKKKARKKIGKKNRLKTKNPQKVCNCYGYNICICEWGYLYSVYIYSTYMYTHAHMYQLKPDHARSSLMGTASALEPRSHHLQPFLPPGPPPSQPHEDGAGGGTAGSKVRRSCRWARGGSVWASYTHGCWGDGGVLPLIPLLGSQPAAMLSPSVRVDAQEGSASSRGGPRACWIRLGFGLGLGWNAHTQEGSEEHPGWQVGGWKADVCAIFRKLKIVPPTKRNLKKKNIKK